MSYICNESLIPVSELVNDNTLNIYGPKQLVVSCVEFNNIDQL